MNNLSTQTKLYLFTIYAVGSVFLAWNMLTWQANNLITLLVLCVLASLALIIKVEGTTSRSHYTFSFIAYGFAFVHLGVPGTTIVIITSSIVEWLVNRPPWFIQLFNMSCYIFVINISGLVYQWINPELSHNTLVGITAITASVFVFTMLNHLIVGIVVWMARGENFKQSGIFDFLPIIIDLTLLSFGAMLVLVWDYNPYALILFGLPIYLFYSTMRVPALERQSAIEQKTGLYNHNYFMRQLKDELKRANRFDRPLTVIMADLDLLRNVNNNYGHLAGDEVLIGIAKILQETVRDYDTVARFGGEEFAILLPETTLSQALARAETIRKAVEKAEFPIPTSITPIKVTLSLGVAHREDFDQTDKEIIHNADTALYHSKLKGRNRSFAHTHSTYLEPSGTITDSGYVLHEEESMDVSKGGGKNKDVNITDTPPLSIPASPSVAENPAQTPITNSVPLSGSMEQEKDSTGINTPGASLYLFIGGLVFFALILFSSFYYLYPDNFEILSMQSWLGIAFLVVLASLTEWYSIDLYTKNTSLSTSAIPILVGALLFGPIGLIILSATYAINTGLKYRSPFRRSVFNFGNQLFAGMLYTIFIAAFGKQYIDWSPLIQLCFALISVTIVFILNTSLITIGMHLESGQPMLLFWKERYRWLFPIYLGMGIVATAFVFGYKHAPLIGPLLAVVPLWLLRLSQVQYVEKTRDMVTEVRQKNIILEKNAEEISKLNKGLLETLAEVIDVRDPYVLGHSRRVADLATQIGTKMGLHEKQVDLIHNASLLHDIGKLGIPENILSKPEHLSQDEYEVIKSHPEKGSILLAKSPHLRPLIPAVRHHHEYYNGNGYPDKLAENQIAIEARIISVADAIEAMSSDRTYRKKLSNSHIIDELKKCSGAQFDPRVIEIAINILEETNIFPLES